MQTTTTTTRTHTCNSCAANGANGTGGNVQPARHCVNATAVRAASASPDSDVVSTARSHRSTPCNNVDLGQNECASGSPSDTLPLPLPLTDDVDDRDEPTPDGPAGAGAKNAHTVDEPPAPLSPSSVRGHVSALGPTHAPMETQPSTTTATPDSSPAPPPTTACNHRATRTVHGETKKEKPTRAHTNDSRHTRCPWCNRADNGIANRGHRGTAAQQCLARRCRLDVASRSLRPH